MPKLLKRWRRRKDDEESFITTIFIPVVGYDDVVDKLQSVKNKSKYIIDLIRKDIQGSTSD